MEENAVKMQLKMLLKTPLATRDFSGKYPTMTGSLRMPGKEAEGAVEALKRDMVETETLLKGNKKKKYKPEDKFKGFKKKRSKSKPANG